MINELKLTNFKCFRNISIPIKNISFMTGGNGAGKSSIIQSLLLSMATIKANKKTIGLNGPYMLSLGTQKLTLAEDHSTEQITIEVIGENESLECIYDANNPEQESIDVLHINNAGFIEQYDYFYLNAERTGPRRYFHNQHGADTNVGFSGEFSASTLLNSDRWSSETHSGNLLFESASNKRPLKVAEYWMDFICPGTEINIKTYEELGISDLQFKNPLGTSKPTISTGFGLTYIFPIVVSSVLASLLKNKTGVLLVENPEAHLHPFGQSRIGRFLAMAALSGVQIIVETHSEHVINGARIEMLRHNATDKMIVNFFSGHKNNYNIQNITLKEDGELLDWPVGFFDQDTEDLKEILKTRFAKKGR